MSGTVNISRGIWSDTAFKDQPFTEREAFMWMVMEASWKPREKRVGSVVVHLERGQLASSIRFMAEAWNWQKSTVDRFLKRLENRDMIGTSSGTGVTVITVCKYNDYQNAPSESGTPSNPKSGQRRDSGGTNENKGLIPEEKPKVKSAAIAADGEAVEVLASVVGFSEAENFVAFRREMKKPMTARSARAIAKQLEGHHDPQAVLNLSIANSWQGIFPEKVQPTLKIINGGTNDRNHHSAGSSQGRQNRPDPALEQIARLAGIGATPGNGGR